MLANPRPRIRLPYPHPGQQHVRENARRFNWLSAGRRWRKTTLAMTIIVEAALKGGTYIWGAPTFDQVRIGFGETQQALGGVADFNLSRMTAILPTGGSIIFRSLDNPDNARGHTADGVVIDEAGFCKRQAWYEVLRPMLIDTGGWAWGIGTPNGRNWFYQEWVNSRDDDDVMGWQVPTLGVKLDDGRLERDPHPLENPNISFDEIEKLWRKMPERIFEQEVLAQFIEITGGVFRRVRDAATASELAEAAPGRQYSMGIDWAYSGDFTVVTVVDMGDRSMAYQDRYNGTDYTLQRQRIMGLYHRFKPVTIISEANAMGRPNNEELRRQGLPVADWTTTNASKAQVIENLAGAFERGQITILNDPILVAELQAFEGERMTSGLVRYGHPDGMHDDTVISLALAYHGAASGGLEVY